MRRSRTVLAVGAVLGSVGMLAACSGGGGSGGSGSQDGDVTTLTWSMWAGSEQETAALEELVSRVEEAEPSINIELETAPFADYWTRLAAQASGGVEACILGVQSPRLAGIVDLLMPLDEDMLTGADIDMSEFDSAITEATQLDGTQYAVPYDSGPLIMYYNKTAFEEAGVAEPEIGWTIDDFNEAVAALTTGDSYGYGIFPATDPVMAWSLTLNGTQPVTESGDLEMNSPGMIEGVEYLQGLVADGYAPQIPATNDTYNALNAFIAQDIAMVTDGPWQLVYVEDQVEFEFGIVPMPAGPDGTSTPIAGSGYGISQTCEYPDEAMTAISIITGAESQQYLAEIGRAYPSRTAQQPDFFGEGLEAFEAPLLAATGEPLRSTKNWNEVGQLFQQYGIPAINGQMTAEEFLTTVQDQTAADANG